MELKLLRLEDDSELYELCRVERESYEFPYEKIIDLVFPVNGKGIAAREASFREAAERRAKWLHGDPTGVWIKVVDKKTGRLLGAALWHVYDKNPFQDEDDPVATWFPEGEEREVATGLLKQLVAPHVEYMPKPHVFLEVSFTAPDARGQGVMSMLLEWGIKEADERGYDIYLDASNMAKHLYSTFGFIAGEQRHFSLADFQPSDTVNSMEERYLPTSWWPMYRPPRGKFEEGKTELPWEVEKSSGS